MTTAKKKNTRLKKKTTLNRAFKAREQRGVSESVKKPEPPGAAIFRAAQEPEPIFWSVGTDSRFF